MRPTLRGRGDPLQGRGAGGRRRRPLRSPIRPPPEPPANRYEGRGRTGVRTRRCRPPPEPPANRYEEYDSLPARCGTARTMSRPLPVMVQILEKSPMIRGPRPTRAGTGSERRRCSRAARRTRPRSAWRRWEEGDQLPACCVDGVQAHGARREQGQHEAPLVAAAGDPPKRRGEGTPDGGVGPEGFTSLTECM